MASKIKPEVHEISLAFNPANRKKFHLRKDLKGEELMEKAIAILQGQDKMFKEKEFTKFLGTLSKDVLSKEDREYITGAYKLLTLTKDRLPKTFIQDLTKAIPDLQAVFTIPGEVDAEAVKADIRKELEPQLRTEIQKEVEKEMKKDADEVVAGLKEQIETLTKDVKDSKELLAKETDARRTAELTSELKDKEVPDPDKKAATILKIEKVDKDAANEMKEGFIAAAEMVKEAVKEIGSSQPGQLPGNAEEKLDQLVKEKMDKDGKLQKHEAMKQVAKENPKLYAEYTRERQKKISDREGGN